VAKETGHVQSLLKLSKRVRLSSWVVCALAFAVSSFSLLEIGSLRSLNPNEPYSWDVDYLDPRLTLIAGLAALLYFLAFAVAGFLSLRWIYRANSNAHRLNTDVAMSPGWNVGWFFVPIATFWKPFEGVREVWRVSANPDDPNAAEQPNFLFKWWAFWVLTNVTATASFRLQMRASTVGTELIADALDVASTIALLPATYFFVAVVSDITQRQQRYAGRGA
jgi:hypothetical protein